MRSYAEFILEANAASDAGGRRRKPGESLPDFIKRTRGIDVSDHPDLSSDDYERMYGKKSKPGTQSAAQNTAQTRSSRNSSTSSNTNTASNSRSRSVRDRFNRARARAQEVSQSVQDTARNARQTVRDVASKAANTTPKQAVQSAKDTVRNARQSVQDRARNARQSVQDTARNTRQRVRNTASRAYNTSPKDVADKVKNMADNVKTRVKNSRGPRVKPNTSSSSLATSANLAKAAKTTSKFKNALRLAGKAAGPVGGAIDVALERQKGSGWLRSLAKGATVAGGGLIGGTLGSVGGPWGTAAGAIGGSTAADKAFDVVAGKNAKERAADRLANRKRQAGGALVGIGGKTTFDTKKNTMTTGSGSQKKTVNLAKTSVVTDPKTGKKETGYLAYKDGKAVYKRAAKPGEGSSNWLERVGRTINPNAYKANDAKLAGQKLQQAAKSDIKRQQELGVKGSKNLVGPKIVGPKIVGPKKSPSANNSQSRRRNRRGGK